MSGVVIDHCVSGSDVFDRLAAVNMDTGALRPYRKPNGKTYVSLLTNETDPKTGQQKRKEFLSNAETTMTKEAWLLFDREVIDAAKAQLMMFNKLRSIGQLIIPNSLGVTKLEQQRRSDITPATISMDGLRQGEADQPQYDDITLPLPIIHKDADFSLRDIAVSQRGGQPFDAVNIRMAGEMVAKAVEELTIGIRPPYRFGGSAVYGYRNFPQRLTHEITAGDAGGWTPLTLKNELIAAIKKLIEQWHNGPFDITYGLNWYTYMQQSYSNLYDSETLVSIIRSLDKVSSVDMSDFLPGWEIMITERNPNVQRAVIGMDIRTLQWDSHGGMKKHYKVMCIMVPQFRADYYGQTGIMHCDVADSA